MRPRSWFGALSLPPQAEQTTVTAMSSPGHSISTSHRRVERSGWSIVLLKDGIRKGIKRWQEKNAATEKIENLRRRSLHALSNDVNI
jgi:hypothetical protein